MGKPKKGKKGRQDDDFGDEEVEVDPIALAAEMDTTDTSKSDGSKAAKKGKKGKKKKDDDWEDDIADEIAGLSLDSKPVENEEQNGVPHTRAKKKKKGKKVVSDSESEEEGGSEDEEVVPQKAQISQKNPNKKRNKGKTTEQKKSVSESTDEDEAPASKAKPGPAKGMSAFQMLAMDDDDDEEIPSDDEDEVNGEISEPVKTVAPEPQQSAKSKKGKKGKQKDKPKEEEEDLDALLAEIDKPDEKKGKKKKKKGGEDEEEAEAEVEADVEMPPEQSSSAMTMDISSMTQDEIAAMLDADDDGEDDKKKKKKNKKKKGGDEDKDTEVSTEINDEENEDGDDGDTTVKTAAQKKKEKKERQKLQKQQEKEKGKKKGPSTDEAEAAPTAEPAAATVAAAGTPEPEDEDAGSDDDGEDDKKKKKKDKKKKKKGEEKEEVKEEKKKPVNKKVKAMQEMLARKKEEEERFEREEDEKEQRIEDARKAKEEKEKDEKEKKEREKVKKKEKMDKLKAEGRYLTPKQKEAQKKAQQMLEQMKQQGIELPQVDASDKPKKRVVYDNKKKRKQKEQTPPTPEEVPTPQVEEKPIVVEKEKVEEKKEEKAEEKKEEEEEEDIKDDWAASSDEEEPEKKEQAPAEAVVEKVVVEEKKEEVVEEEEEESEEEEEEEEEEESSEDESSSEEEEEKLTPAERIERQKEKAREKMQQIHEVAESKRSMDHLRAPVVCVLGHVDTGKTKILDKLRRTNVQDGEAGGITQQIGATNVPEHTIREQTKMCKEFSKKELKIPGLLIIDTPGHESFANLRNRGSSLCDIAILVIDIMHGLEPQTIESIGLLKKRKTPFVVALNKIDRLFGWQPNPHADVHNTIKKQKANTKVEFDERVQQVVVQLAEQGLNAALYYENKNMREYINLIPTSAHSGDGMGSLIALICELTQTLLAKRIMWSEELQAITMEVKAIPGLGTTVDVILVNGMLREGETVVLAGTQGPIVTQIRGLLMPQPLKELRVKGAYVHCKEVMAAQGVKIIAKDLEHGLAGLPMHVARTPYEIEVYKEDISEAVEDILESIRVSERGVFVQASTLGSLEALLAFLRTSKIPFAGINIGPVHRRDIIKTSAMLEHDDQYAVLLAFDVKIERDAQTMADDVGVKIFTADIIYHLFDQFMAHREDRRKRKQAEFKNIAVFPVKIRVMPQFIFNSRDPIVMGVIIEQGFVKSGTPLCVPNKEFLDIGIVTSIEINNKQVDMAKKGQEVCIKIDPIPGDAPKMFGRHFDETDVITSKISRQSIDAVKDYFREEMGKGDWQLMLELKNLFKIL